MKETLTCLNCGKVQDFKFPDNFEGQRTNIKEYVGFLQTCKGDFQHGYVGESASGKTTGICQECTEVVVVKA